MSQNFDFVEPRETDTERAARENRLRTAEIARRFVAIDRERIRPLAALVAGAGTDEDKSRLNALENEAKQLRTELARLEENNEMG